MSKNFDGIKTQKFGVEIECTGLTGSLSGGKSTFKCYRRIRMHYGGGYDKYTFMTLKEGDWLLCPTEVSTVTMQTEIRLLNFTLSN